MSEEEPLPTAKEFAERLLALASLDSVQLDNTEDEEVEIELREVAKIVAKHVISQTADPEVQLAVDVDKLSRMQTEFMRYQALLAEVGCNTPEDRAFMEVQLDKRIAGANAFQAPLIVVPTSDRLN